MGTHPSPLLACCRLWLGRADLEDRAEGVGTGLEVGVGLGLGLPLSLRRTSPYEALALPHLVLSSGPLFGPLVQTKSLPSPSPSEGVQDFYFCSLVLLGWCCFPPMFRVLFFCSRWAMLLGACAVIRVVRSSPPLRLAHTSNTSRATNFAFDHLSESDRHSLGSWPPIALGVPLAPRFGNTRFPYVTALSFN